MTDILTKLDEGAYLPTRAHGIQRTCMNNACINRQHLNFEQAFCTNTTAKRNVKNGRFIGGYELDEEER